MRNSIQVLPVAARTIEGGNIVLFHRTNTACWFARLKVNEKWIVVSTGSDEIEEAKSVALTKYAQKTNPSSTPLSRQFSSVAEQTVQDLRTLMANGQGKQSFQNYIDAIHKYLVPCFLTTSIEAI